MNTEISQTDDPTGHALSTIAETNGTQTGHVRKLLASSWGQGASTHDGVVNIPESRPSEEAQYQYYG